MISKKDEVLRVNGINVFYGALHILKDVSLKVKSGEIVVLIGPNGSGKTTLFNAILGLLPVTAGSIEYFGERIELLPTDKRVKKGIVLIPEGRKLFPNMTVMENLELGSYTVKNKGQLTILDEIFNLFPILKERKNQLAGTLSGGEAQMLAIARGLMAKPKLLILDEPSFGLAPKLVLEVFDAIKRICKMGVTILLAEQHVHLALDVCDRGYVIENGIIQLEGTKEELIKNEKVRETYLGE